MKPEIRYNKILYKAEELSYSASMQDMEQH